VKSLTPRWLFQHGVIDGVSNQTTPIVVDGTMYVTDSRGSVYALDAADGHLLWSYDVTELIGGGAREGYIFRNRGAVYANGVVYTAGGSFLFALDAKSGKPIQSFGKNGQASVLMDVLAPRYEDVKTAISVGYWFTTAPQYYNGTLYIGSTRSESHIPGGYVLAVDAQTGKVKWSFNTVPQNERDQGWDIAGPTWVGGERNGGGIWETAAIDPQLGLLYMPVGNPFGDSTKRAGINLFTDSVIALTLDTGTLKWFFQETHHDVWDYDSGAPPTLFDMQVRGQRVRALAHASKNGYLYILNRETGQPIHPIKEMPVPTTGARAGEQPWPTQPIPFTASGKPMEPVCPIVPLEIPPSQLRSTRSCRSSRQSIQIKFRRLELAADRTTVRSLTVLRQGCSTLRPLIVRPIQDAAPRATSLPTIRRLENWSGGTFLKATARRAPLSPLAASCSSGRAATSPATSTPTTPRLAICSGSSTRVQESSHRRRSTW